MAESETGRKKPLTEIAKKLARLSGEKKRAALESSAALAGVSLRVSREFVEAVPAAARIFGEPVKKIVCVALMLLLTACVPIGFRAQNLPNASIGTAHALG